MSSGKTVLVTGANGFIGREVVNELEIAGWVVTKAIRSNQKSLGKGFIEIDLNDPASLLSLANEVRFDAIVHLGAHIGWHGSAEAEMYSPNVLSTSLLSFLAAKWNSFLVFSSAAIVCGVKTEKISINSPIIPDTPYGKSKYLGEQLIAASNIRSCILRIAGTFGPKGPTHLGLNQAIDSGIRGVLPVQTGSGKALRNYIYVKDVGRSIVYALDHHVQGIHFLAGSEVLSVAQMLGEVCDIFLPGQQPVRRHGPESSDQIIESSYQLPQARSFYDALLDIKSTLQ